MRGGMRRGPRANSYRDTWCGRLRKGDVGREVRVAGWVHRRRDHGGLVFIDLRDRSGVVQLVFHPEHAQAHTSAHGLRPEQVLSARGKVVARSEENVNEALETGEIEIEVGAVDVLAGALTPPFPIDEETHVDELVRLRYRPLDLRRASMARALALRHELVASIRRELWERDFMEVETPLLTRSTPEGARDFLVPSRLTRGAWYALPQSPQLFKQLLMVGGVERYFQIARCFRDEDLRADRQPEFTQLDLEMAFVHEDDVIETVEEVMAAVLEQAGVKLPGRPWPRISYDEALARFGTDRPDGRFGMQIRDVSDVVRGSEFRVFQSALDHGGVVRALNAGTHELSRAELEGLNEVVRRHGGQAVAPIYVDSEGSGWRGNLARFFSAEQIAATGARLEARPGDLLLFVADAPDTAAAALGGLRVELAARFGLIARGGPPAGRAEDDRAGREADHGGGPAAGRAVDEEAHHAITWVVDFPMFEWNAQEDRWDPRHHPFTAPATDGTGSERPWLEDPGSARSRAYDLVLDGVEIGGGSIRIHDAELQLEVLRAIGIDEAQARTRFGFLLDGLRYGAPPHGGIALGIDRIVALCAARESIRDVIAFPKTASGLDPLTGAPAPVDQAQLRELGLRQTGP
jgi:aspartyl-tRNA synthetase